jgi:hypothetical protein
MWAQQALAGAIGTEVDSSFLGQFISTKDQQPNQLLALQGSIDGSLATLDLSEASDRVSWLLVETMFSGFPHLQDSIRASRSDRANVGDLGIISLNRYASMGSALCFPVETMVFLAVVLLGIEDAESIRFRSVREISRYIGRVRVYGDDIVIPVEFATHVIAALELYGFKVNEHKSFWTGRFRESCGKEYYLGEDVTLCRMTQPLPSSRGDVDQMVSAVSFRNHLYRRGLWKTAAVMDVLISEIIPFPVVSETSQVLGRISCLGIPDYKLGRDYQNPMVKGMVVRFRRRLTPINDDAALMKTLSVSSWGDLLSEDPRVEPRSWFNPVETDADHLVYAGRPEASAMNFRMAQA